MSRAYVHGLASGHSPDVFPVVASVEKRRPEIRLNCARRLPTVDDSHMTTLSQEIKMADCRAAVRIILLVGCFSLSLAIFSSNDDQERKVRPSKYVLKLTEGFFFR